TVSANDSTADIGDDITLATSERNIEYGFQRPVVAGAIQAMADSDIEHPRFSVQVHHQEQRAFLLVGGQPVVESSQTVVILGTDGHAFGDAPRRLPREIEFRAAWLP